MVCVCALFSLTGCYNTEPRESVLKIYNWADYIDEDMLWRNFPGGTKNRRGKIFGLSIRLLTSMKSC